MDLWIWTTLYNRSQRRPLLLVQFEGGTWSLAVLQALRSFRVEAQQPVPDDLQAYSRKAGRIRTAMTIVDHRKRKQATALRPIPAPLRNTTQISGIKVSTQRKCSSHDNPPIQGAHLESEIGPAGNPPHESGATASGISAGSASRPKRSATGWGRPPSTTAMPRPSPPRRA